MTNDATRGFICVWHLGSGSNRTEGTLRTVWTAYTDADEAVGQVNHGDSTSNDWLLTGVQMEIGSQATNFEHRSFGEELALCQRYYYQPTSRFYPGVDNAPGPGRNYVTFPVTMRSAPSVTQASITSGTLATIWTGINVHNYEISAARPGIGLVTPYKFDAEL